MLICTTAAGGSDRVLYDNQIGSNNVANKRTVHDCDAKLEELHRKLVRVVGQIDQYRKLRKRIATGKVKAPPPEGVRVKFKDLPNTPYQIPGDDDLNDPLPDDLQPVGFGSGVAGPC